MIFFMVAFFLCLNTNCTKYRIMGVFICGLGFFGGGIGYGVDGCGNCAVKCLLLFITHSYAQVNHPSGLGSHVFLSNSRFFF